MGTCAAAVAAAGAQTPEQLHERSCASVLHSTRAAGLLRQVQIFETHMIADARAL